MVRIYGRLGWEPMVLSSQGEGRDAISAGLWHFSEEAANRVAERAGLSRSQSRGWYNAAFEPREAHLARIA